MIVREMPPRGHYTANEAGRLAGVSGQRMGQWARYGYIRSSQSEEAPRIYSYQDIAEAMVVHALVDANLDYEAIKDTIEGLREQYGYDWPLSHVQEELLVPAGKTKRRKRTIVHKGLDMPAHHPVLHQQDLEGIATDLRRGGWAARDIPDLEHIEVDPDRFSGRPVIRDHRVPAEHVARIAQRPGGRETLREDYDLTDEQINDALRWWQAVTTYEARAA